MVEHEPYDKSADHAYYAGKRYMEKGNWEKARKSFEKITVQNFEDTASLLKECDVRTAYEDAEALFEAGNYYQAYKQFDALKGSSVEGLPNMDERAQACVQGFPATGTVYVNPDYQSSVVPLTIRNQSGNTFFKIYNYDALAMTIFIRSGESASVSLPAGTYRMNEAHGEQWFGDKDMFGDEGLRAAREWEVRRSTRTRSRRTGF